MKKHGLWIVAILVFVGIILGTLGTWSVPLGYGISAFWPAFVVQVAGSAWFGGWGVLAAVLFPVFTNSLANVGLSGIFGFIPANLAQGLIPSWAFRYFRVDQALLGRKELAFYAMWGALIPAVAGGLLGSISVVLLGGASWSEYPLLVVKWAAPHIVVSLLIGIPIMRELTPIWRDLGILVKDWWGFEQGNRRESPQRFQDAPIQLKLLLAMCISSLGPLLVLSLLELAQNGGNSASGRMMPLFLTISLVASVLAVGLLSRETVRPLQELKEQVNSLMQHRDGVLTVKRTDEIGQLGQTFAFLLDDWHRADSLLQASESRFRLLAENSTDMISRHDPQGVYIYVSPASRALLGYEPEELIGHSALEFIHPEDIPAVDQSRLSIVEQPVVSTIVFRARHKSGEYVWLESTSRSIIEKETSGIVEIHVASRDVTERKRAEMQLKQRVKELNTIYQSAQVMQKLYSLDELAPEIIRILETMLDYKFGSVLLIDEASNMLYPFALSDQKLGTEFAEADKTYVCSLGIHLGQGITGWVAQNGQSVRLGDVKKDPRYIQARDGINSELCAPLKIGEKIIGVINVETPEPNAYTETDQYVLEAVAAQIAASLQNAHMFEIVQKELDERKHAEKSLKESQHFLNKVLNTSPNFIYIYDLLEQQNVYTNQSRLEFLGYDLERIISDEESILANIIHPDDLARIVEYHKRFFEANDNDVFEIQYRLKDANDNWLWVRSRDTIFARDSQGRAQQIIGNAEDITARKQTEDALRESEERYQRITEAITDYVYTVRVEDGRIVETAHGPGCLSVTGYRADEFASNPFLWLSMVVDEDRPLVKEQAQRILAGEDPLPIEHRLIHKNGTVRWVKNTFVPHRNERNILVAYDGLIQDITERKLSEEALRESEEHFHSLYDNATIGMYRTTPDGRILLLNPAGVRMLGYVSFEEIATRNLEKDGSGPNYDRVQFRERMKRDGIITGLESAWKRKDGSTIYVRESATAVKDNKENIIFYDGTFEDITERKQAEEVLQENRAALRESNAKLETLIQVSPLSITLIDLNGNIQLWNSAAERIFGWSAQEIIGRPNPIVPPSKQNEYTNWSNQIIEGKILSDQEAVRRRKDGSLIDVSVSSSPMYDSAGNVIGRMAIIADISKRKQDERTIKKSEEKFSKAFKASPEAVTIASMEDGRYVEVNDVFLKTTGFSIDEVIDHTSTELNVWVNVSDRRRFVEELTKNGYLKNFEVQYRMRNGAIRDFIVSSDIIELEGKPCSLNFILDITERKQAEEQIQKQLARLNALRNIDDAIKSSDDLRFTLKVFLGEVAAQLKVDAVSVLLFNKNSLTLDHAASHGFRFSAIHQTKLGSGQDYAGRVILDRKTIHIPDFTKVDNKLTEPHSLADENFTAYVGSPLVAKGQVVGVLEIFHRSPLEPTPEWFNFLNMLASQAAIAIDNAQLFENLQRSNFDLTFAYDATIEGWSRAMDLRDKETEGHTQRVTSLTVKLAQKMGIPNPEIVHIRRGALLHDIGKMGVPDNILLKPGKLTQEEWDIMRQHTNYAYDMLLPIHYLKPALDIPQYHHERWDGTGYPHKLKGEDIPLAARIFAVVDVWDAVTSDRPYQSKWSKEKALKYIKSESGKHFDPKVVEMFLPLVSHE